MKKTGAALLAGATLMVVEAIVFVVWSQFYRSSTYIQGEEDFAP